MSTPPPRSGAPRRPRPRAKADSNEALAPAKGAASASATTRTVTSTLALAGVALAGAAGPGGEASAKPPGPPASASADRGPPPLQAVSGERIGRYLVVDQLGEGGMGVVYKAYDPELGRLVAIKRLRRRGLGGGGAARLVREAQAVAQLAHPNVVAVHDVGQIGDDVFIAMEFVDGWRLREWLAATPRPQRVILAVFAQAAAGLAAAHDRGLVHRDFKPHNVLVGHDGRVRVVDFGLARPFGAELEGRVATDAAGAEPTPAPVLALDSTLTPAGVAVGTPRYMAPEQHLGRPLDGRADQFAFCVALWEAVVGSPPFPARTLEQLAKRVIAGERAPLPRGSPVPRWLRQVLVRGLAADPAARFPSMHEVLAELVRDRGAARRGALGTERLGEHLLAAFPPDGDAAHEARVRELHGRLEKLRARKERGLVTETRAQAEELLADFGELGHRPLRAAILALVGELRSRTGDPAGAQVALEESLHQAAAAGDDWQVASSWILLVYVVGAGLGRVDEAEVLAKAAHVACRRVGDNPSLGARLCNSLGLVRLAAGRAAAAAGEFERALALDERTYGARHWFVALSALNLSEAYLDAGDAARAAPTLARAAEICSPEAPSPSPTRARCLWLMARLAEAQADTRRAHAGYLAAAGAFARCPGELERAEAARAAAGRLAGALGASPTPPGAERGA